MTKQEFLKTLLGTAWTLDSYGHYHKHTLKAEGTTQEYRLKIQATSVRLERAWYHDSLYAPKTKQWSCVVSDYYKNITVGHSPKSGKPCVFLQGKPVIL